MKSKFNLLIVGSALLAVTTANAQTWGGNTTNAYLNPTTATVSFGSSAVPLSGVKVDVNNGMLRLNGNQLLLAGDLNHGIGWYGTGAPFFATSGPFANIGIDGPVIYGYRGGALGSNMGGTKNIALRWLETGLVGIGTTSPVARLQINSPATENSLDIVAGGVVNFRVKSTGYVYARDLTIQAGTFPDYVFANGYKLMPLTEVKSFIQKNSRLPEMPPACEVEKEGMSVSQINVLLVQKVEELTLYLIKLQEELDQLKNGK